MQPDSRPQTDPRIDDLLRRIAAIEERLGIAPPPAAMLDRLSQLKQSAREAAQPPAPPSAPAPPVAPDETGVFEAIIGPPVAPPMNAAASSPAPPLAPPLPARPAPRHAPAFSLEKFIGIRMFAAVGAIGLVIGVVLFLKLAIDNGWLRMPASVRCLSAVGFGFVLLALGELARRKINAIASAGLSAAGIGMIYGAAWFAYARFHLVGEAGAFAMLAAASLLGVFVAARANLVSVAIVSLVGAYLAPIIANAPDPAPIVYPLYLLALLGLGLGLSALRATPFRPLRGIVWWATVLFGTGAVFYAAYKDQPLIGLAFLAIFWAAVHAEIWHSTRSAQAHDGPPPARGITWRVARPIITTFGTTMWCAAIGVWSLASTRTPDIGPPGWSVTALLVLGSGAIAFILAGNLRALIDPPESDRERLGVALMTQAGALVIATIAIALSDSAEVLAGIALGAAAVFAGRWIRSRALDVYGLIVLSLTVGRLVLFDSWAGAMTGPGAVGKPFLGLSITEWTWLMLGAAAGWALAGALLVRGQAAGVWRSLGIASIAIALCVAYAAFLSPSADAESLLIGGMLLGAAALGIAAALRSAGLLALAMNALALMCGITLIQMTKRHEPADWPWRLGGVLIARWGMILLLGAAVWTAAAAMLLRWVRGIGEHYRPIAVLAAAGAILCMLLAFLAPGSEHGPVAWVWLALAAGVLLVHRFVPGIALDVMGMVGIAASAALWAESYALNDWASATRAIGLHPGLLLALAQAATMGLGARALARRRGRENGPTFNELVSLAAGFAVALVFASTSLEVRRAALAWVTDPTAQQAALSIWWGIFAVALIVIGFARRVPIVRHTGLALMTIAAAKVVVLDLSEVADVWRIVLFMGLGLMMLGIAVGYAKLQANLDRADSQEPDQPDAAA